MTTALLLVLVFAALTLVFFCAAPAASCNQRPVAVRTAATLIVGWLFFAAAAGVLGRLIGGIDPIAELRWPPVGPLACGVYYDGISSLTLLLVSFIGLVVCRYSIRYLDGDPRQGNYFRWVAATIGSVSLLVLSGNLLMLAGAWISTSLSLHHLLLHFPSRAGAQRAAWTKFAISRAGDLFLVMALALLFREFGTFDLSAIFAAVASDQSFSSDRANALTWIGFLIVLVGITKSAQFPLHSWLPETLETPTPVSALMHAGVVNAGGYLIIRLSPLVVHAPASLSMLAFVGTLTVVYAGLVMLTQSSVKKALAYSTVAQMGFMMLQCGIGAFSAAMLHLIAHSLYKAYAFLNSGSVLQEAHATRAAESFSPPHRPSLRLLPALAAAVVFGCGAIAWLLGFDVASKPGGYVLAAIVCLALTMGLWQALAIRRREIRGVALAAAAGVAASYIGGYFVVDSLVGDNVAQPMADATTVFAGGFIITAFVLLALLQIMLRSPAAGRWRDALYVHSMNGFYVDVACTRIFGLLAPRK